MSTKAAVKQIRGAIDGKDFVLAVEKAQALLIKDPDNYVANLYLGVATDRLNKLEESEAAYLAATRIKPTERTPWQGLIVLYEKQGNQKLDAYHTAVLSYGQTLADSDELERCQDLVNKYTEFARNNGSKSQLKHALELQLPSSPLYSFLEGRLPHPSHTYLRIIEITEAEEKAFINREIGERRTRLGARLGQVTSEVKREAFARSELEALYQGLIDWTTDDSVRRQYEEKILQRLCDELEVLPKKSKNPKRKQIIRAAEDMVIIKHPFELAWEIAMEWKDTEDYAEFDVGVLREFIEFFPENGLSKVLDGFLSTDLSPFPQQEDDKEQQTSGDADNKPEEESRMTMAERLIPMINGAQLASTSILAHRLMADVYHSMEEYESAAEMSKKGKSNIDELVKSTGLTLTNATDAVDITYAQCLIFHQSPRHHPEAKQIFERILQRKPKSTSCLLGIGLILKVDEDYSSAIDFLQRALERDDSNLMIRGELAWCKALNGDLEAGLNGLQDTLELLKQQKTEAKATKAELLYRTGYCQWEIDPSPAARKDRSRAYASFLASITTNFDYAPAYTSLGFYYADYKKDKNRARQCFQRAFELSPSEIEAAKRLSQVFADKKDWDYVQLIAQRAVDSGRAKPAPGAKRKGHSWPYAALGTAHINKQEYPESIGHFQTALRISPDDYNSWVGLAEGYHHSGRHIAAINALEHALGLEESLSSSEKENIWFARHMLANVKRELREYDAAIEIYEDLLKQRPDDAGNKIALLQTLTESSWKNLHTGLFNDAAELAVKAINVAQLLVDTRSEIFNLWKLVGDACSLFSYIKRKADKVSVAACKKLITTGLDPAALEIVTDVDEIGQIWLDSIDSEDAASPEFCIHLSLLAFKRAVHVAVNDKHALAVAWYNLGWAEYHAYRNVREHGSGNIQPRQKYLMAAVGCFKKAIESEAGNAEFWNSLGVVTASLSPKVSQHSLVRSLHLNERNAQTWTNLGALYLLNGDAELANMAFTRAQSSDPQFAQAWVGQAAVALSFDTASEARGLFEHAFDLSRSSETVPKRHYALSLFDHLLSESSSSNEVAELIRPFFALHQLVIQDPSDMSFVHLSALVAERMGETADAQASLESVCSGMEAEYENSESVTSLLKYAQANADSARVLLACHEYEQAAEAAQTALSLADDEEAEKCDPDAYAKLRLSAHLTAGLAYYFTKSMDEAIDMFGAALHEADNDPDVVCLLAQVLWAKGGEEERSLARKTLVDCTHENSDHVGAATLLGAIAILDGDNELIKTAESNLKTLLVRDEIDLQDRTKLLKLLGTISTLGLSEDIELPEDMRRIKEATAAIMLSPGQPQGWTELSNGSKSGYPAEMAIDRALRSVPPHGNLEATDLSQAYAQSGNAGDALRSIMVAPWRPEGWGALKSVV
ncbi:TPR-like protein [Penicillium malachiteum]|uniref:TPR-like protein n=1 Tax=Penicillium malachiteum TaxID=1324776 RepID=UPI0025473299|nr:TPR-like protein [Penicillium malachiteum]KAJ5725876.1 TPR-like protein [Penicillium malachiteum]